MTLLTSRQGSYQGGKALAEKNEASMAPTSLSCVLNSLSILSSTRQVRLQSLLSNLRKSSRQLATLTGQHKIATSMHDAG